MANLKVKVTGMEVSARSWSCARASWVMARWQMLAGGRSPLRRTERGVEGSKPLAAVSKHYASGSSRRAAEVYEGYEGNKVYEGYEGCGTWRQCVALVWQHVAKSPPAALSHRCGSTW